MHGLHRVGYSHGADYQGWNYAPVNQIKNIDYITSSSIHWHIKNERKIIHLFNLDLLIYFLIQICMPSTRSRKSTTLRVYA